MRLKQRKLEQTLLRTISTQKNHWLPANNILAWKRLSCIALQQRSLSLVRYWKYLELFIVTTEPLLHLLSWKLSWYVLLSETLQSWPDWRRTFLHFTRSAQGALARFAHVYWKIAVGNGPSRLCIGSLDFYTRLKRIRSHLIQRL